MRVFAAAVVVSFACACDFLGEAADDLAGKLVGRTESLRSRGEALQLASIVCFAAGGVSAVIATVVPGGAFGVVTVELP